MEFCFELGKSLTFSVSMNPRLPGLPPFYLLCGPLLGNKMQAKGSSGFNGKVGGMRAQKEKCNLSLPVSIIFFSCSFQRYSPTSRIKMIKRSATKHLRMPPMKLCMSGAC
jgi:hypothetical protein